MHKYLIFFQQTWQTGLAYPLSFLMWRFRQLLATVMSLTVWTVIFSQNQHVFGYDRSQMITYILLIGLLQGAIIATDLNGLASEIYTGTISQLLIKPINMFGYFAVREAADKGRNLMFMVFESGLFFMLLKPNLPIPSLAILGLFFAWVGLGVVMNFFIQILFGTLGFWTPDVWGPKFLFFVMVDVTAGRLFPLDILPDLVQKILYFTPFPYLSYAQTQLFLGRLAGPEISNLTFGLCVWIILLSIGTIFVWKRGIKDYTASGQ